MTNTLSLRASVSERGNLNGVASDLQNSQLAIQGDCHESVCTDSRNDEKSTKSKFNSRQIPKKICRFFTLFCRFFFFFWCGDFRKFSVKKRADCGYFWDILLLFYIFLQNFLILKNDLRLIYLQFIYFFIRGKSNHSLGKFSYR